jgi:hypothetical protein
MSERQQRQGDLQSSATSEQKPARFRLLGCHFKASSGVDTLNGGKGLVFPTLSHDIPSLGLSLGSAGESVFGWPEPFARYPR